MAKHKHHDSEHPHYKKHPMAHGSKGKAMGSNQSMLESHGDCSENLYSGSQNSSKHGNPKHIARDQYRMAPGHVVMSSERRLLSHTGRSYPGKSEKK